MKHALNDPDIRGQFAGHETFPLRLLWLKKVHDAVTPFASAGTFTERSAIARFGVGRNMAVSMRYWALASRFVTEDNNRMVMPTPLGVAILADAGYDPFLEHVATVWLVHWGIASTPQWTSTAYFAFNVLPAIEFDPATLVQDLMALVQARGWRASATTLKRDIEVFLRSYVRRDGMLSDDGAEPLLAELHLVREARLGGWYEFVRGPKPDLPDGIFAYALHEYWERTGTTAVTVEQVCYASGSPGRVFKLDENSVVTRLMRMEALTQGGWRWTETAGLRQLQKIGPVDPLVLLAAAYGQYETSKGTAA
ncbi:DUF4007 family protein [Novacetimonas pomaceti]|uniref:DUF4007 domain-containing protein n=1 Tax=Novacetimonas pomaceti TaxID=2021998 RepID=A0A318Q7J8_9PROT|nr:DUF4007 family protein [Novacetimonas pomaceti]PYD74805.1 hypothetical protein CFR71_12695 [Novacetimonas pomaceti]